ncbi:hypothetical protein B0A49_13851, partial [Cryomyces minteri]
QYLNTQWEKKWINLGVNRAKQLWKSQYRDCKSREATPLPLPFMDEEPDDYDLFNRQIDAVTSTSDQFEQFINSSPIEVTGSPLDWWLEDRQRRAYPQLSIMATDVLSIATMAAESERVFSCG